MPRDRAHRPAQAAGRRSRRSRHRRRQLHPPVGCGNLLRSEALISCSFAKPPPTMLPLIRELEQQAETAAHWARARIRRSVCVRRSARVWSWLPPTKPIARHFTDLSLPAAQPEEWEIENVVVAAEQRRHGVGTALVGELLRQAHAARAASVLLEVRESNHAARQLYEKLGLARSAGVRAIIGTRPRTALLLRISIAVP